MRSLNLIGFGEHHDRTEIKKSNYRICFLILKFLKVIQRREGSLGKMFVNVINERKVPIWIFLHFIPQIISVLSLPSAKYFENFFMLVAEEYPEALIYQFNSQFEDLSQCSTEESKRIYHHLRSKYPWHFILIEGLDTLNHPELRLQDALPKLLDKEALEDGVRELKYLVDSENEYKGQYLKKFAKDWNREIQVLIRMIEAKAEGTNEMIYKINEKVGIQVTAIEAGYNKLSNFSLFFELYGASDIPRFGLMTEQYKLGEEPIKEMKVFIESFDQSILTLVSLRKPKRLTMFANNEKKYHVLVKGGEDLRLDQRIEQIFSVMNIILLKDTECEKREHFIRRFEVVPIKNTTGLLEWVDNTRALRTFLEKELREVTNNPSLDMFQKNDATSAGSSSYPLSARRKTLWPCIYLCCLQKPSE